MHEQSELNVFAGHFWVQQQESGIVLTCQNKTYFEQNQYHSN